MGNSVQNCNRTVSWAFTYTLGKSSPPLFFFMDVDRNLAKPVSEVRSGGIMGGYGGVHDGGVWGGVHGYQVLKFHMALSSR